MPDVAERSALLDRCEASSKVNANEGDAARLGLRTASLQANFRLSGFVLYVEGEIGCGEERLLEGALARLIATSWGSIEVDISGVYYLNGDCARRIARAMRVCCCRGRSMSVRARKHALLALQLAGVDRLGRIEFADRS